MIFHWEFYVNKYDDLTQNNKIQNEKMAYEHWCNHGKKEQRIFNDIPIMFNWKNYIKMNEDLQNINNEEDAWKHFLYYAKKEKRTTRNLFYLKKYFL